MKYECLKVDGKEYKLRFSFKTIELTQKELGKTIQKSILDLNKDSPELIKTLRTIIWGSMLEFQNEITLEDVNIIFNHLVDKGYILNDFIKLVYEILLVSGILDKPKGKFRFRKH